MSISMDHIAIASQEPEKTKNFFRLLKLHSEEEEVDSQKVKTTFFPLKPSSSAIEILEPTSDESPIAKFLENRSGIHHIALQVNDLQKLLDSLSNAGIQLINSTPQPGSRGTSIAFVHPKSTGGVLIELVENN